MDSERLIFAIGNPLLDISSECTPDVLEKYSLIKGQACLAEEKHKALFDELWHKENVSCIPGGAAMNVLRCANFMLEGKHPNSCTYFGAIADDERGEVLRRVLDTEKINHNFYHAENEYTGACAVVVTEKERALCADLGACLKYSTEHIDEHIDSLAAYKIIYTTGFFISSNVEALKKIAKYATEHNKIFAFNLSAVFLIDAFKDDYKEILEHADIVFGNEDECDAFGKAHEVGSTDRKDIAQYIAKLPKKTDKPRTVIMHQGPQPAIVSIHDPAKNETNTNNFEFDVLPSEKVIDTNSAGDAFAGGYLAALSKGHSHETAMKAAAYCARYIIQTSGCSFTTDCDFQYPELS